MSGSATCAMQEHPYHEALGGSWWCLVCVAPASIEDPGESNPLCGNCGKRHCQWRREENAERGTRNAEPPVVEFVPDDAATMVNKRRLPRAERPTISQMAYQGYWLCKGCGEPTKRDEQECCVLCGSSRVEFQPPTL